MVAGTPFFLKRGAKYKRGPKPPPSFGKRGLPPILKYQIYQPSFPSVFGMKISRKYRRVHTEIPNRYTTLVILLARRYADICLLAVGACLLTKIVFLSSRMSTKIDFCGATGYDHGGWQVAAAAETETTSTAEAAAVGQWRHRQWRRRKHRDNNDGDDRRRRLRRRPGITLLSAMATIQ
jgi:hypothetical protein